MLGTLISSAGRQLSLAGAGEGLATASNRAQRAAARRRNEITQSHKEKTVVLQDVSADPTLPRTRDVMCQKCQHNEAVFFSAATEEVQLG